MVLRYLKKIAMRLRQLRPIPDLVLAEMYGGYSLLLRPSLDEHERQLFFDRTYEPALLAALDLVLRPGDVMVDVGANLGIMTLHAARAVGPTGTVVAIEPHPSTYARLIRHIRINRFDNIKPVQIAAGATVERRMLFDFPSVNIGRASLLAAEGGGKQVGTVDVDSLDNILSWLGVEKVRMLKIDVEGFEPEVLRGASRIIRQGPIICMEVSAEVANTDANPLAAHDIIMSTGLFCAYTFLHGKRHAGPLKKAENRSQLARQVHDNVVYIPKALRGELPPSLFEK